jgi:hypothetical protein
MVNAGAVQFQLIAGVDGGDPGTATATIVTAAITGLLLSSHSSCCHLHCCRSCCCPINNVAFTYCCSHCYYRLMPVPPAVSAILSAAADFSVVCGPQPPLLLFGLSLRAPCCCSLWVMARDLPSLQQTSGLRAPSQGTECYVYHNLSACC